MTYDADDVTLGLGFDPDFDVDSNMLCYLGHDVTREETCFA